MENCGTVSHATMRPEDLIPAFLDCLESQSTLTTSDSQLCERIRARMEGGSYFESEDSQWDLDELFDTLDTYAPSYFYFGAHEGDGSDYGFWLSHDVLETAVQDGEVLKVSDLGDVPEDWTGEVLQVSDHGNPSLYRSKREWIEVWAIV